MGWGVVTRLDHRQDGTFRLLRAGLCAPCEGPTNVLPWVRITACSRREAQFSHSGVSDSATPQTAARQASLFITNSRSLLQLMSTESVMPPNHLILRQEGHSQVGRAYSKSGFVVKCFPQELIY